MRVDVILSFVSYFLLDSLIIYTVHLLTGNTINTKITIVLLTCLNAFTTSVILNEGLIRDIKNVSMFVFYLIAFYSFFERFILYAVSFKKIDKQIVWLFLAMNATNQIYSNITIRMIDSSYRVILAYFIEAFIIMLAIVYIKRNKKEVIYRQIVNSLSQKLYILILVLLYIASFFIMVAFRDDTADIMQYFLIPSMIGLVISTIALVKISVSESEKNSEVALLSKQVENQIEYYEKINKIYSEFRSFRHDYKNHVLCLRGLIAADKKEEVLKYMETMQEMSSIGKNKYHTGNIIIDALLDDKSDKAEKVNTKIELEGVVPTSGISNADLCIIMANAIDNAIEACTKDRSDNEKTIKVYVDFKQGYFFFKCSNPMFEEIKFKGKNKLVTSKTDKEHHGFGVSNIFHTAEKYDGTAEILTDNETFTIEVQLRLIAENN